MPERMVPVRPTTYPDIQSAHEKIRETNSTQVAHKVPLIRAMHFPPGVERWPGSQDHRHAMCLHRCSSVCPKKALPGGKRISLFGYLRLHLAP